MSESPSWRSSWARRLQAKLIAMGTSCSYAPDRELVEENYLEGQPIDSLFTYAMTKRMLHHEWNLSIDAALDAEADAQAICMQTGDFRRAYAAFVAKQKPKFEGD